MANDLSPENEQFIRQAVHNGAYRDRGQALDRAVELLTRRQDLLEHIEEGTRQFENGQYTEYDRDGLRAFFDEVQAQGRKRYEANRNDR